MRKKGVGKKGGKGRNPLIFRFFCGRKGAEAPQKQSPKQEQKTKAKSSKKAKKRTAKSPEK